MARPALRLSPLLLCAACVTASVAEPARPVASDPSPVKAAQLERSPVPAPQSLVMLVRAARPEETLRALGKLYPLPLDLGKELEESSGGASRFIDFAESFELAVVVAPQSGQGFLPQLSAAISLPLKPDSAAFLDFAAKKGAAIELLEEGRTRIAREAQVCELWAREQGPSRLICSNSAPTLSELGPWLARTVPTLAKPSEDVQLRLDYGPLNADLNPKLAVFLNEQLGLLAGEVISPIFRDPRLSADLVSAGQQLLSGLNDLGSLNGGLQVDQATGRVTVRLQLEYQSKSSWFTRLWTEDMRLGPPPAVYFQLPRDSEGAFFGRGFNQSQFSEPRAFVELAWKKGIEQLAKDLEGRLRASDTKSFAALIPAIPRLEGEWAWAFGSLPAAADKPVAASGPEQEVLQFEAKYRQAMGWSVFAAFGELEDLLKFFERGIDAEKRFAAMRKAEADQRLKRASAKTKASLKAKREALDRFEPKFRVSRNPVGYPKGSALIDVKFGFNNKDLADPLSDAEQPLDKPQPEQKLVRGTLPLTIAMIPDGKGRYLWGLSADADVLKAKLLGSQNGAPSAETLAARTDLGRVRGDTSSAGYVSVAELARRLAWLGQPGEHEQLLELLGKLGDKSNRRLSFAVEGVPGDKPKLTVTMLLE